MALIPLLILWFGLGEVPAIMTAFLISFFPIGVNVATGLATTIDSQQIENLGLVNVGDKAYDGLENPLYGDFLWERCKDYRAALAAIVAGQCR